MTTEQQPLLPVAQRELLSSIRHELGALRDHWWWFLALGIALIILGTIALGSAVLATVTTVVMFGLLLAAGGVLQIISAFWAGRWSGLLVHLLIGVLYVITGFLIVDYPFESAIQLTLLIAFFLLISGLFRIIAALLVQFHEWPWVLLNGVITLFLGVMVYKQWPASGLWVIGMFVGIELIFNGWTWIALSLGLRSCKLPASKSADA